MPSGVSRRVRAVSPLRMWLPLLMVLGLPGSLACNGPRRVAPWPHSPEQFADIFYFEGAGEAEGLIFATGVRDGFEEAGWRGRFHLVDWNTGTGPLNDHLTPISYKRAKAAEIAPQIAAAVRRGHNVYLIGFSAGTAVLLFALEELPPDCQVRSVVLLSSSVTRDYDLTEALRRVSGSFNVSVSRRDAVLRGLVPLVGTADGVRRVLGACAGIDGFRYPVDGAPEVLQLYGRVANIPWLPLFSRVGNDGDHYGPTNRRFVAEYLAPLIMADAQWRPGAVRPTVE